MLLNECFKELQAGSFTLLQVIAGGYRSEEWRRKLFADMVSR